MKFILKITQQLGEHAGEDEQHISLTFDAANPSTAVIIARHFLSTRQNHIELQYENGDLIDSWIL